LTLATKARLGWLGSLGSLSSLSPLVICNLLLLMAQSKSNSNRHFDFVQIQRYNSTCVNRFEDNSTLG
jgi:hypothetical protein